MTPDHDKTFDFLFEDQSEIQSSATLRVAQSQVGFLDSELQHLASLVGRIPRAEREELQEGLTQLQFSLSTVKTKFWP
jgi:hypothetical protein